MSAVNLPRPICAFQPMYAPAYFIDTVGEQLEGERLNSAETNLQHCSELWITTTYIKA